MLSLGLNFTSSHVFNGLMLLNCGVGKDSWEFPGLQRDKTSQFSRKSILNFHQKDWCWSWSSSTLATWCEELTPWKRPWCWERLKAAGEGGDRGWDGWMASLTRWIWIWAGSGSWWWTGRPAVLQFMGLQRVRHDWATQLNWWPYYHFWIVWGLFCVSLFLLQGKLAKKIYILKP